MVDKMTGLFLPLITCSNEDDGLGEKALMRE